MKIILQDSSFIISIFHKEEPFNKGSLFLKNYISNLKNEARIIVPTIVFFETIFKLSQIGVPEELIKEQLSTFLYHDQYFNVGLVETSAFRLFKKFPRENLKGFKTSDYLILSTALAFDAHLLTYDKKLRRNAGKIYNKIYYCDPDDKEFGNDTEKFIKSLR